MDVLKITIVAIIAVVATLLLRQVKSEFATVVTVCASVVLAVAVCDKLFDVVSAFYDFSSSVGISDSAISCVVKVVGIGYVAEFSNNLCVDANCKSLGDKVLLASKISILFCALPIVEQLFDLVKSVLP